MQVCSKVNKKVKVICLMLGEEDSLEMRLELVQETSLEFPSQWEGKDMGTG